MESSLPKRNTATTLVAILAIAQGVAGILRAFQWFDIGGDLIGKGLFLLPLAGLVTIARGILVAAIALSFVIFAGGLFFEKRWAKPLGIVVAVINLLLAFNLLIQGESLAQAVPWVVVPAIILFYLTGTGKRMLADTR